MNLISKHRKEILIFFFLTLLFFFSRLYKIETLPLFTDEAIYVRWSQIARFDPAWRFISLTDGKQPSFVWIAMNVMRFVEDPLLASRLVSVGAGFFSLIGIFFLAKEIFKNKWIGLIASSLYLIYPMALVYDRMALYDSLVFMFAVWSLYFEILLVRYIRLDLSLILGFVLGGAILTKTNAFFFIYLLPFTFLLFDFKKRLNKFLKLIGLGLLSVFLAHLYYAVLRLSPLFHIVKQKDSVFVYTIREWLDHPFRFFIGNLAGQIDWLLKYMTIPVIILLFIAFFLSLNKFYKEKFVLLVWFFAPFLALALFGKTLYPRFIFFMTMPLLLLTAFSIYYILQKIKPVYLKAIMAIFVFGLMVRSDYFIINNFPKAPIPYSDLEQYINNWPAGGGVKEIINFLDKEAQKGKIYVASEGTFGSLPTYAVEIYLGDNKNVEKRGMWPLPPEIPADLAKMAEKKPVYFIFNNTAIDERVPQKDWPMQLVGKYQKGIGNSYMSIYRITPK